MPGSPGKKAARMRAVPKPSAYNLHRAHLGHERIDAGAARDEPGEHLADRTVVAQALQRPARAWQAPAAMRPSSTPA